MGHKVHPVGFRIGVIRDWQAKWYADKHYAEFLQEDMRLRGAIQSRYAEAGVSLVEIERQANQVQVTIYTARPGIVIGRGGQRVDEVRRHLEQLIGKRVQLNIQEIQQPELDAHLVAKTIAEQIERRIAYRRAMKQVLTRTMQAGAKGMKVSCAGRLGGAEIARRLSMHEGQVPLHTMRADIDYGFVEARTAMGRIGVKVWIYKGEILPETKVEEVEEIEEAPAEAVVDASAEAKPAVEPEEVPAEAVVDASAEAKPAVEPEEVPAEAVVDASAEAKPVVEPEEAPAEAVTRRRRATPAPKPEEVPAEVVVDASAEAKHVMEPEEAPAKPVTRRRRAKPAVEPEEAPTEAVVDASAEAESSVEEGEDSVTT